MYQGNEVEVYKYGNTLLYDYLIVWCLIALIFITDRHRLNFMLWSMEIVII